MAVYDNGASFQEKKLFVTDGNTVDNLNASKLQGKEPSDFVRTGNEFGIEQTSVNDGDGPSLRFDESFTFKIGNITVFNDGDSLIFGISED